MKLIIQVPCLDEEEQLPKLFADLPRSLEGFSEVEWLVIDDGSTDGTAEVALRHGVDHLIRLRSHKGLATAFQVGLDAALKLGADVIVNIDADGQYPSEQIPHIVAPILDGTADLVVGDRNVKQVSDFTRSKRTLQSLGSFVVSRTAKTPLPDATSGFRAYSREAALQVVVLSTFTYTLETLIQAGASGLALAHVPIERQPVERRSRLFASNRQYIWRSTGAILRASTLYWPVRTFLIPSLVLLFAGLVSWLPYIVDKLDGDASGHVQSVVLGAVFVSAAVQFAVAGFLADILGKQRRLSQLTFERVRRVELALGVAPSHYESNDASDVSAARD